MIVVAIVSLIISLLLQGLMSNFLGFTIHSLSIFSTVYVLVNLVVLQPYFKDNKKFLIIVLIFGMLMDIVYSNTFILCAFIFLLVAFLNRWFNFLFPTNLLTINVISCLSVILFHIVTFLFLKILNFDSYTFLTLLKVIGCNLLMSIIYTSFLYEVIHYVYKRMGLKIVRE